MDSKPIRVAIVDDDEAYSKTIADVLRSAGPAFELVASSASGEDALQVLPRLRPDVIIMDIRLPGISGVECVRKLSDLLPKSQIVMLTVVDDLERIFESIRAGALGYLLKSWVSTELVDLIFELRNGGSPISGGVARPILNAFRKMAPPPEVIFRLTERETEVLEAFCRGKTPKDISKQFGISPETVRKHAHRVYKKLHVHSRREAVQKAQTFKHRQAESELAQAKR